MREGLHAFAGLMTDITRPVLKKRGFSNASLLQHWSEIVGEEMSRGVRPEKITYGKKGGILYLKVTSGAFAVMVEHRKKNLLDRIASFNGHAGIVDIKVSQGNLPHEKKEKEDKNVEALIAAESKKEDKKEVFLSAEEEKILEIKISGVEDEELRKRLLSLGKSILLKQEKI